MVDPLEEAVERALAADRTDALFDVFAGIAFGALVTRHDCHGIRGSKYDHFADEAYLAADAMMRARQRHLAPK